MPKVNSPVDLVKKAVAVARLSRTAHNSIDLIRDAHRKQQTRGGIVADNHNPINHHRLAGYIDTAVSLMGRGGDSRTRVSNNVSLARRKRDNDAININRPLG